jgi:hypothetical protein
MKKTLLIFVTLLIASFQLIAQSDIPNPGLEDWVTTASYSDPVGWTTPNALTALVKQTVVYKDTVPYEGNFAARLESKTIKGTFKSPGTLTLGQLVVNMGTGEAQIVGGMAYDKKATKLKGYFKYQPAPDDACGMFVILTKYDSVNSTRDTVGYGFYSTTEAVAEWTEFVVNVNDLSAEAPDTMNIIIVSSFNYFDPVPGSILTVDALVLEGPQGIFSLDTEPETNINVYPNPAREKLTFELEKSLENAELIIYSSEGREIMVEKVDGEKLSINISDLPAGTYYYNLLSNEKRAGSGTFIVQD